MRTINGIALVLCTSSMSSSGRSLSSINSSRSAASGSDTVPVAEVVCDITSGNTAGIVDDDGGFGFSWIAAAASMFVSILVVCGL